MIDVVIGCLLGVLGGAVMSPLLHKWLTKKLTKKIHLDKGGFMCIYLPNKLQMTIWDSYSEDGWTYVFVYIYNWKTALIGNHLSHYGLS